MPTALQRLKEEELKAAVCCIDFCSPSPPAPTKGTILKLIMRTSQYEKKSYELKDGKLIYRKEGGGNEHVLHLANFHHIHMDVTPSSDDMAHSVTLVPTDAAVLKYKDGIKIRSFLFTRKENAEKFVSALRGHRDYSIATVAEWLAESKK